MPKAHWSQTFSGYALCLVAFSIPFPFIYSAIAVGIVVLAWLIQLNFKDTLIRLKERKALWLWIFFYILHIAGYFYSEDKAMAFFDLEKKMSFVVLPVVVGAGITISRQALERIFFAFVAGMFIISIWCMGYAAWRWNQTNDINVFFYHDLIKGLEANAVYMAWYCLFSICLLLFMKWEQFFKNKAVKIIVTLLLIIFFVLLSSRMLIALFFAVLIPFYFKSIIRKFSKAKIAVSLAAMVILLAIVAFTKNPIRDRYENIFNTSIRQSFLNDYSSVSEGDFSNLTLRVFLWRIGILNMNEHHLWLAGAGIGDVQTLQNNKMAELGIRNIFEPVYTSPFRNANLHNMYMQILLMLGIIGLLSLIFISFSPLFNIRHVINKEVFLLFHIIAIAFMMQEAILQTQAGVIYYTFFSQIFWNIYYSPVSKRLVSS